MNDSNDSRIVRLPVRDMRDEPAPQRAAQEGGLPPLLTDERIERIAKTIPLEGCDQQTMGWGIGYSKESDFLEPNIPKVAFLFARAIESEVRTAIAAAGGGVPQRESLVAAFLMAMEWGRDHWASFSMRGQDQREVAEQFADKALASSPQPEAAMTEQERDILQGLREIKEGKGTEAAPAVAQVPDGWKVIHVESKTWGEFIDAMDRAERKGYLPDAVVDEWLAFDYNDPAAALEAPPQAASAAGEVERGDVVAFEFYNRATGHAIVDYSVNTHVGNLSAAKGYESRPLVYAAPRQNVLDGSKPIPAWQAREALDELEAAARGDAPFNHQAAAVVRAALNQRKDKP